MNNLPPKSVTPARGSLLDAVGAERASGHGAAPSLLDAAIRPRRTPRLDVEAYAPPRARPSQVEEPQPARSAERPVADGYHYDRRDSERHDARDAWSRDERASRQAYDRQAYDRSADDRQANDRQDWNGHAEEQAPDGDAPGHKSSWLHRFTSRRPPVEPQAEPRDETFEPRSGTERREPVSATPGYGRRTEDGAGRAHKATSRSSICVSSSPPSGSCAM